MFDFIKQHWLGFLGAVAGLWVIYELYIYASESSSSGVTSGGTSVISSDPNADALQAQNIQAQSQLAASQQADTLAATQAQLAEQATLSTNATNIQLDQINAANALAITNSNNTLGALQSNNGLTVALAQANNVSALQAQQYQETTAEDWYNKNIALAGLSVQQQANQDAATLAAQQLNDNFALNSQQQSYNYSQQINNNYTQLQEYGIQAQVSDNAIAAQQDVEDTATTAAENVDLASLNDQLKLGTTQIGDQYALENTVAQGINAGVYNKGGQGGSNQVLALSAVQGAASSAASGAATTGIAANGNNQAATILSGISNIVKSGSGAIQTGIKLLGS